MKKDYSERYKKGESEYEKWLRENPNVSIEEKKLKWKKISHKYDIN